MTKSKIPPHDPHADREAGRYENPIASREFIMEHLEQAGMPLKFTQLAERLDMHSEEQRIALQRRLGAMERDGQLLRNRRDGYCLVDKADLVRGRVIGHPDGFGFLVADEGGDDLFLTARQMRSLLHGDRAMVRVTGIDRRGRREGALVEVLERANHQVVGRFFEENGIGYVTANNKRIHQDILIPQENRAQARHGEIVVAEIVQQPGRRGQPIGRIAEILGDHMAPGMEIDVAIRAFDLPRVWSQEAIEQADSYGMDIPRDAVAAREDLRQLPLVTIDGADARDFDDAVYCEPHGKGWRLLVAIADVSHYVAKDSPLDVAAVERGNSVYFPERVIPMLPEVLSNGLCSLNPDVERLCMVCEMFFKSGGRLSGYSFFPAVMRSHARLTYSEVAAMLVDNDAALRERHAALLPHLENLYALYKTLSAIRDKRGAIDFETTETRIVFGADRKIERIVPVERNDAHKLIEECMITANIAAADFLAQHDMPTLYRVHQGPGVEKLEGLRDFLAELGLSLGGGDAPEPKHYAKLLSTVRERPDAHLIQTVMLRSLKQAVYSPENLGHFGLALEAYAHFTSPIRRYPDLLVHRAIKHVLQNGEVKTFAYNTEAMLHFGEHCSMTDRRADEATRDAIDWLKCEYMMDKVGDEFDGIVSSATSFGLFVELNEIYVEGLIHVTSLPNDYYHFDPVTHRLTAERTGRSFRLGDQVRVKVVRVDLDERKIDFDLIVEDGDMERDGAREPAGARKSRRQFGKGKAKGKKKSTAKAEPSQEAEPKSKKKTRKKRSKRQ